MTGPCSRCRTILAGSANTALLAALEELSTRGPSAGLDEIAARLRSVGFHDVVSHADLLDLLDQLAKWSFAEPFRDYSAQLRDLNGVLAREESWALTRRGRGIVASVREAVLDAGRAVQLPARLLDSVERTVRGLIDKLDADAGLLPMELNDVRTRTQELQRVTADFYAALARLVQSDVTDDVLYGDNRDRVLDALRQFPREYGRALRRVDAALAELRACGHRRLVETAAVHAGPVDPREQQYWIDERLRYLSDLEAWFESDGTVARLIASASGAVYTMLIAIDRRYIAQRRGSDLGADFRMLAHSLHRQESDPDARRVYAAAFGDWPARHAVADQAREDVSHGTPADVGVTARTEAVTLREHERPGRTSGPPRKVPQLADQRAGAVAAAVADAQRRQRLAALLVTPGEVGLEYLAGVPGDAVMLLLAAIEVAVSRVDDVGGAYRAPIDGTSLTVEVRAGVAGRRVSVRLAEGVLSGPDLRIRVFVEAAGIGVTSVEAEAA